ncbi:MAG: LytTR family DNA-binding domain-containing protein [Eubacteriales bacterium]
MLQIALCDDNNSELLQLKQLLGEFTAAHISNYIIQYHTFSNGFDLLSATENGISYDIIILDVVMPVLSGINIATEIRKKDSISKIIFLTSSRDFALDSYKVDAYHYLLKPIKSVELIPILEKACEDVVNTKGKGIIVKTKTCLTKVFLHNIEFTEISGRNLCFHLSNGKILESLCTMNYFENDLLINKRFFKPHRSFIVNMDYIDRITDRNIITSSNKIVPISRERYTILKQTYIDYSFDRYENT